MNELKVFRDREFGEIRTAIISGKTWFVGSDVARALDYSQPHEAIKSHCKGAIGYRIQTGGGNQVMKMITEGDLYQLVVKASAQNTSERVKGKAERFETWIFDTVLPSIHKNGGYIANQETLTPEELLAKALIVANNVIQEKQKQIEELSPKAGYFDDLVDSNLLTNFRDTAEELGYRQNEFTGWLLMKKYIYKDSKGIIKPYSKYVNEGLFAMKDFQNPNSGYTGVRTFITVKGKNTFRLLMQLPEDLHTDLSDCEYEP